MGRLRAKVGGCGIKLDEDTNLRNIRYADDLMIYAMSLAELSQMTVALVEELQAIGLHLNSKGTRSFTSRHPCR